MDGGLALGLLAGSMKELRDVPDRLAAELFGIRKPARIEKGRRFVRAGELRESAGFNLDGIFRYYYLTEDGADTPFQGGRSPSDAISPALAASKAIEGLDRGREEIRVGMARTVFPMSRLAPSAIARRINASVPADVEELLAE
jgi:hypothetical protein